MQNLVNRMTSRTPRWFRIIRNIGLILTAAGTAIVTIPLSLPAAVVTAAGYLLTAGAVAAAVAQTATVADEEVTE